MDAAHVKIVGRSSLVGIVAAIWPPSTCVIDAGFGTLALTPPENQSWGYPWQRLVAANLPLAWHSDWPYREPSAIHHLYGLATGRQVAADGTICEPPPFLTDEAVGVRTALHIMTLGSAYALGLESVAGSLEPGKLADLIILDEDPLDISADDVKDVQVLSTVIGGITRHCAPGSAALCP